MPTNPDQKLNHKLFDKTAERVTMRQGFGEGLVMAGTADKNVVALCADLTESVFMKGFKDKFNDRFIVFGVAECLAKNHPVPIEFIGMKDCFGQSGTSDELIEYYEMGEKHIYAAVQKVILRKR